MTTSTAADRWTRLLSRFLVLAPLTIAAPALQAERGNRERAIR